ncbi:MAG TPA: hypothetical protein VKY80_11065 [Croceibacterium sp.]|nr:hypothetical protein [Croceibacterium sp.]
MRRTVAGLVLATAALPASALATPSEGARMAEELSDPLRQEQLATAAEAVASAVLDMPAAPLLRAARTLAGEDPEYVDPDLRFGDLMAPEANEAPYEFSRRLPQMMAGLATATATLEAMLPELRAMGDRIAEDMARDIYE